MEMMIDFEILRRKICTDAQNVKILLYRYISIQGILRNLEGAFRLSSSTPIIQGLSNLQLFNLYILGCLLEPM